MHKPSPSAAMVAIFALTLASIGFAGTAQAAVTRVFAIDATPSIARLSIRFDAEVPSHTVELRNFGTDADPVIYVLDPANRQVASRAASNGRLSLPLGTNSRAAYTVIVRSRSSRSPQTGDLWIDGALVNAGVAFAQGASIALPQLAPDEKVMAVAAPLGPGVHDAYLFSADGSALLASTLGTHTAMSSPSTQDVIAVYSPRSPATAGPLRVYRNDVAHDSDGDGLGDELEDALGTCASSTSVVAGVNCNEIADTRDTDGDGLQDGWEVLGIDASFAQGNATRHEFVALPTWGADPRHKDIFIEVDFRRLDLTENQNNVVEKMTPDVARHMAGIYADVATTDFWLKAAHAVSVDNPDRTPGISLHLDTGVPPEHPEDATIYGDWGGYNPVDATASGPQDPGAVWQQQMSPARHGVFHYVMGYTTGGGACGEGIACGFDMHDAGNSAHEFGHTIGLDHNGPYTVQDEPNCKPNYPSLMNYAYLYTGYLQFSDGRNFPQFNNHSLLETNAVDPSNQPLMTALETYFQYKVDHATGSVDWNRDGQFAPANVPVRAYANYQPGGECEFTREDSVATPLHSEQSPAIVQVGGFLWVFALDRTGQLGYTHSTVPWTCAINNLDNCATPQFVPVQRRNIGVVTAIDAKSMLINGRETIVVVAVGATGGLVETTLVPVANVATWGPTTSIPTGGASGEPSLAAPSQKTTLALAYRSRGNTVQVRTRTAQGWSPESVVQVGSASLAMYPGTSPALVYTGLPLDIVVGEHLMLAASDSNGYLQFYSRQFPLNRWGKIPIPYAAMTAKAGRPVMAWTGSSPTNTTQLTRRGLPSAPPLNYGRLYVIYLQYQAVPPIYHSPINPPRMMMSYVGADGVLRIGLDASFDNEWAYAYGLSAITPTDGALRVAMTSAVLPNHSTTPEDVVYFRPHADGMKDLTYYNYDDWKALAHDSCTVLAATQTSSPVHCAVPW